MPLKNWFLKKPKEKATASSVKFFFEPIKRKHNKITYENHWLERGCVYYNVGKIGKGMQTSIDKGSVVRRINSFSKEIVEEEAERIYRMLRMTEVTFVKYKELTVLPYPLKLLKEASRMDLNK